MCQNISPTRFKGILCPRCGYDLRGLPERVCPECGQAFDEHAPAASDRVITAASAAVVSLFGAGVHLLLMIGWSLREIDSWYCRGCCRAGTESITPLLIVPLLLVQVACLNRARSDVTFCRIAINAILASATTWLTCMTVLAACH